MIKKIHYIWVGGNKKSRRIEKCLASWERFFPDWEIIEWNEENLNMDEVPYCRQAYDCKKYAFVSDYFRFRILYQYGGLYLDTDVEILRPFDDLLADYEMIFGFENKQYVAPGLICYAGRPGLQLFHRIYHSYQDEVFLKPDGSYNLFTVCERITPMLEEEGFQMNDTFQTIHGMALFPHEYFCPTDYVWSRQDFTDHTRTIHHYDGSWGSLRFQIIKNTKKTIYRVFKPGLVKRILTYTRKMKESVRWKKR